MCTNTIDVWVGAWNMVRETNKSNKKNTKKNNYDAGNNVTRAEEKVRQGGRQEPSSNKIMRRSKAMT